MAKFKVDMKKAEADAKTLNISVEDAIEMQKEDWESDHGIEHDWDMSEEEHRKAMKNANVGEKKTEGKTERKRKENPTKRKIINEIATFLDENDAICPDSVEITNPERVIRMVLGEDVYEITLSQKRKPKN